MNIGKGKITFGIGYKLKALAAKPVASSQLPIKALAAKPVASCQQPVANLKIKYYQNRKCLK